MPSWGRHLLALLAAVTIVGCSSGGSRERANDDGLHFVKLPAPPRPIGPTTPLVENADTVVVLTDGRLFRYDPWEPNPIWLELNRNLPSAKTRVVEWNDRAWYLTTDRGRLDMVSVTLSGDPRTDSRSVAGSTDASWAIVAARNGVYVFGAESGFFVDRLGNYHPIVGPPSRDAVADWSRAAAAELVDGSIAVVADNRVRLIYEPEVARWREPADELTQLDIRSVSVASEGLSVVAGSPPQAFRIVALNRVERLAAPLASDCATTAVFVTDVGPMAAGCGKVRVTDGAKTREIDMPANASIVSGPRGRPLAVATNGELSLLR